MLGAASRRGKGFLRLRHLLLALALACFVPVVPAQAGTIAATASSLGLAEPSAPDYRTNGKIFAFDPVRGAYTCSGTALDTPSGSIVLTAGHCDMARGSSGGGWLVEGLLDGVTSYGYPLSRGRLFSPYFGAAVGDFLAGLP